MSGPVRQSVGGKKHQPGDGGEHIGSSAESHAKVQTLCHEVCTEMAFYAPLGDHDYHRERDHAAAE
jgi:hypothetical protein